LLLSFSSSGLHILNQPPDLFTSLFFLRHGTHYLESEARHWARLHICCLQSLRRKSSSETRRRLMTNTNPSSQQEAEVSSSTSINSAGPRSINELFDERAMLPHAACVFQDWELARRYVPLSWLLLPYRWNTLPATMSRQARTNYQARYSFFAT
jgi:hypothetical protein